MSTLDFYTNILFNLSYPKNIWLLIWGIPKKTGITNLRYSEYFEIYIYIYTAVRTTNELKCALKSIYTLKIVVKMSLCLN